MKSIYSVIKSSLVSEKSSRQAHWRKYVFLVDKSSNKIEIRQAVEKIYKVKVAKVSSSIIKGKIKKIRWNQPGKTTDWKKAIVTLKPGNEIKFT